MATPLGIASASGAGSITIDTSLVKGAGRMALIGVTFNGPDHSAGSVSLPTAPAGFTELILEGGSEFYPGVAAWWGPLETQDSILINSSPATVHLSGSVVPFDNMGQPIAKPRFQGYGTSASDTFLDSSAGGWMAIIGLNTAATATCSEPADVSYDSPGFSGATVLAGDQTGFASQAVTFTISELTNYAYTLISFPDATDERSSGPPTSTNAASSFHLYWEGEPDTAIEASVDLKVLGVPAAPAELVFFALNPSFFNQAGDSLGGAHLGLQLNPDYPNDHAVNWGGYDINGEVAGTPLTIPSAQSNPNTGNYDWQVGRKYRLRIYKSATAGYWIGSVTDLVTNTETVLRELIFPGSVSLGQVSMWTENFLDCSNSEVLIEWTTPQYRNAGGQLIDVTQVWVNYQTYADGGCTNTNSYLSTDGVRQASGSLRTTTQGTTLTLPTTTPLTETTIAQFRPLGESTSNPTFYKLWTRKYDSSWPAQAAGDGQNTGDVGWDLANNIVDRYDPGVVQGVSCADANRGATGGSTLYGVYGDYGSDGMIQRWINANPQLLPGGANVLSIMIGVNDIGWAIGQNGSGSNVTLAGMKSQLSAFITARQSEGWDVVVATLPYFRYPSSQPGKRSDTLTFADIDEWNDHIRALNVEVVDIGNDGALGPIGASGRSTEDDIHFNPQGNSRISDLMFAAVNSFAVTTGGGGTPTSGGTLNVIYNAWKLLPSYDIPLSLHTAAGNTVIELVTHRGPDQDVDSPSAPAGWETKLAYNGTGHIPGLSIFAKVLDGSEADLARTHPDEGSAGIIVVDGSLDIVDADVRQLNSATISHGSGFVVIGLATNSITTIGAPSGWAEIGGYSPAYSGGRFFYKADATAGNVTFPGISSGQLFSSLSMTLQPASASLAARTVVIGTITSTGTQRGAGIGTDIGSTDLDGSSVVSGSPIEVTIPVSSTDGEMTTVEVLVDIQIPGVPAGEGYGFTATAMDGATVVDGPNTMGSIISGEPKSTLTAAVDGGNLNAITIEVDGTHDTEANLRPPPVPSGSNIFATYGNHEMIDWFLWSLELANNDLFGVAARTNFGTGPQYWCSPTSGGGSGTQGSPFSPANLLAALNARSLAPNCIVHMAAGNYAGGLAGGSLQVTGGGGGGGWVTLLGPEAGNGVAECKITSGQRGWSMGGTASNIQYVRLHAQNDGLNAAFAAYANGAGAIIYPDARPAYNGDSKMAAALSNAGYPGQNPGSIGFQLDGYAGHPGPAIYVNCSADGWGEGFGSYQSANCLTLGCVGFNSAHASPNGRSNFSFSWAGGGWNNPKGNTALQQNLMTGNINAQDVGYYAGAFACLSFYAFQLHPSTGIYENTRILDGNGLILPTDGSNNERGRFFQQANIIHSVGAAGSTGFGGAIDGTDIVNNTIWATGYNNAHINGTNPFSLPLGLVANRGFTGSGPALLLQRFFPTYVDMVSSNNIAIHGDYESRSLQAWNRVNVPGRGNVWTGTKNTGSDSSEGPGLPAPNFTATGVDVTRGTIIVSEDPMLGTADAHLQVGSPAIGQGYLAEAPFKIDFMGEPLIDRGAGRCDAGALQSV